MLSSCPEAPERGRLLLRGEPNAALLLGPRIGQRLGEAGDRESAGAVPAPHGAPNPFASSSGQAKCFATRLNMGRHQVERIERKPASPRWGWSGVQKIVPPLWAEAELRRVAGLLSSRQSSIENIVAELLVIGSRYHRK